MYRGFGLDLATENGEDSWTLPLPTRLVIAGSGEIRAVAADPDYTVRPEPEEVLPILDAIRSD